MSDVMIEINEKLGFLNYEPINFDKSIHFFRSDALEVCLPDFTYVALDVVKYDLWWYKNNIDSYVPECLEDILNDSGSLDPERQYKKSVRKTSQLLGKYQSSSNFGFVSPVLTEHFPSIQQGRHRFWLARYFKLPFIVVSVNQRALGKLLEQDLLYSQKLRSRYVFNRNHEIIRDLAR